MRAGRTAVIPTKIMGILNVTPDSFSDGGRYCDPQAAVARALEMQAEGAAVIDVGGESTRPGSARITASAELARIIPVLEALQGALAVPVSIDTRSPEVAAQAIRLGATFVNCVAVDADSARTSEVIALVHDTGVQLILTHVRGALEDMHKLPRMNDPVRETYDALKRLAEESRLPREQLLLDPGIGFGKNGDESYALLRRLDLFQSLGYRLVVGTSRKRFLSRDPSADRAEDRDFATAATVVILGLKGCDYVRVHNVRAAADVSRVVNSYGHQTC